jgi:acyl-ACP thioesterase
VEHTARILLRANDVDFTGRWRPSAILMSMQQVATEHSALLGNSRADLLDRDMIWILSRTHLHMSAYPMLDEEVVMRTWPGTSNRFFFPRHFVIEGPDGARLGAIATLWLVLDLNARAVVPPAKAGLAFPDTSHLAPPLPTPERVQRVDGAVTVSERSAVYTDLDVNRHVNNTRYADWVCDALPLETLGTHCVENLLLNYSAEILPGQAVRCTLALAGERFSMYGESSNQADQEEARVCFEIGGSLAPWRSDRRV